MSEKKYRLETAYGAADRVWVRQVSDGSHSATIWALEHADAILAAMNGEGVDAEARGMLERMEDYLKLRNLGNTADLMLADIHQFLARNPEPEAEEHSCRETAEGEGQPPMEKPPPVPSIEDRMIESVDKSAERYSRIAIVNARVAAMQVECAGMVAENNQRQLRGEAMAYGDEGFGELAEEYDLTPEAVEKYLGGALR